MSRLSQTLAHEQKRREMSEKALSKEYGWQQQSFSQWKTGTIPRAQWFGKLADFLRISPDMVEELVAEAKVSTGKTKIPKALDLARAYPRGKVSDRKAGKFRFDEVPSARYSVSVDTIVMEPAFLVGKTAWVDPSLWAKPGNDVLVYGKGGVAWIGKLESFTADKAEISQYAFEGNVTITGVQAIHVIVLSERV